MNKFIKLKEYKNLFQKGVRKDNTLYTIFYVNNDTHIVKVSAKKKIGNAVIRNYEKRVLRHILRKLCFNKNYFILAICKQHINNAYIKKEKMIEEVLREIIQQTD